MFTLVYMSYLLNLHSLLKNKPVSQFWVIAGEDERVFIDLLTVFGSVSLSLSFFFSLDQSLFDI